MFKVVTTRLPHGRLFSTALNYEALEKWIATPKQLDLSDTFNFERVSDLYITLPTRDGVRKPYETPRASAVLPYGHHLAFFHQRLPESQLRPDGTEGNFCPPEPFTRRMWSGGKITWNDSKPLKIGGKATAVSTLGNVEKKGFNEGLVNPMVFVQQKIEITMDGNKEPSVLEERSHVYLVDQAKTSRGIREVKDIPSSVDFSFTYTPSLTTLFRFSALMFNAHLIHLDQEYSQLKQGYPERLVHGPLTALMLLEVAEFHYPGLKLKNFEYRARNPIIVNRPSTINGTWIDNSKIKVWCVDDEGAVGMTGVIEVQ